MKRRPVQSGTLRFVLIAVVLMLLMDQFVFGGKRSYIEDAKTGHVVEQQESAPITEPESEAPPVRVEPEQGAYFESIPSPTPEDTAIDKTPESFKPLTEETPPEPSVEVEPPKLNGAKIAIIIDDLGMDIKHSKQVLDLPAPITLAFLPYAPRVREMAAQGKAKGHELIIHTPMEALDGSLNIGPGGLKAAMSTAEFQAAFEKMMDSFDGYVGINNHMGSRLTQDKDKMDELMTILSAKGLFFVDSKTIQSSVAAKEAAAAGVKYAERDVFLDHVESRAFVDKALAQAERTAAHKGYAIAIGHPKSFTIEGLKAWIPTLAAKGIELVPVSELLVTPKVSSSHVIPSVAEESGQIPPPAAPSFGMTGGEAASPLGMTEGGGAPVVMTEEADIIPMEQRPDVPAPAPEPAPAPSVDLFPEGGLNTTVPSDPASGETILWHPPQPIQSPAP